MCLCPQGPSNRMGNGYANGHCTMLFYVICESMYEKNIGKELNLLGRFLNPLQRNQEVEHTVV